MYMKCRTIYQVDLPHRAIAVYQYLKDRADKSNTCFPAINTIANDIKLSRSTVKRAIVDLEMAKMLTHKRRRRESGARTSSMFYLMDLENS